jgi:tRNA threonylcarbamoyl adenosine modification protein YeaZ
VLVLALDTSSAAVSAAVVELSGPTAVVRSAHAVVDARGHSEQLAGVIGRCLDTAGARPGDLDAVVAGSGPGPFTGLRVGLVTAGALAEALGIPVYTVCSLDAIAAAAGGKDEHDYGGLIVLTDARRKEVYWARYDARGQRVDGPTVSYPADVPLDGVTDLVGAGAELYFADAGRPVRGPALPAAADLVPWALDRIVAGAPSDPLTPLYLRRPDAVPPKAMSR